MTGDDSHRGTGWDRRVVSVCGPSGSGKSTLAVRLEELSHEWASRVPTDWYLFTGPSGPPGGDGYAWDWSRLTADLPGPHGRQVWTPPFDFARMRRDASGSVKTFTRRPIMLVDAMVPFPEADLVIRLEVGAGERRRRLAERDVRWGTNVLARWDRLEASSPGAASESEDLVLDGGGTPGELTRLVLDVMRRRFGDDLPDVPWGDRLDVLP